LESGRAHHLEMIVEPNSRACSTLIGQASVSRRSHNRLHFLDDRHSIHPGRLKGNSFGTRLLRAREFSASLHLVDKNRTSCGTRLRHLCRRRGDGHPRSRQEHGSRDAALGTFGGCHHPSARARQESHATPSSHGLWTSLVLHEGLGPVHGGSGDSLAHPLATCGESTTRKLVLAFQPVPWGRVRQTTACARASSCLPSQRRWRTCARHDWARCRLPTSGLRAVRPG